MSPTFLFLELALAQLRIIQIRHETIAAMLVYASRHKHLVINLLQADDLQATGLQLQARNRGEPKFNSE
jgi:hypothetical protein